MTKNEKILIVVGLTIAIVSLGVAYAAYTYKLNITANGKYNYLEEDLKADLIFTVVPGNTGNASITLNSPETATVEYKAGVTESRIMNINDISVVFNAPGSYANLNVNVKVEGAKEKRFGLILTGMEQNSNIICTDKLGNKVNRNGYKIGADGNPTEEQLLDTNASKICKSVVISLYGKKSSNGFINETIFSNLNETEKTILPGTSQTYYIKFKLSDDITEPLKYTTAEGNEAYDEVTIENLGGSLTFDSLVK